MWLTPMRSRREESHPLRRFFEDLLVPSNREPNGHSLVPALDLRETDDAVMVETELPGVETKDLNVEIEGDILTIRGERRHEKEDRANNTYLQECSYGAFERQIRLPAEVERDKADATFTHGILKIRLPKKHAGRTKPTTINVK